MRLATARIFSSTVPAWGPQVSPVAGTAAVAPPATRRSLGWRPGRRWSHSARRAARVPRRRRPRAGRRRRAPANKERGGSNDAPPPPPPRAGGPAAAGAPPPPPPRVFSACRVFLRPAAAVAAAAPSFLLFFASSHPTKSTAFFFNCTSVIQYSTRYSIVSLDLIQLKKYRWRRAVAGRFIHQQRILV